MKRILLTIAALGFLTACPKSATVQPDVPPVTTVPPVNGPVTKGDLAWGSTHPDWDKWLTEAVNASSLRDDVSVPCKTLKAKACLVQAISIMAKYESSFKPDTSYKEGFNDASGNSVISRGLLQISIESANQKAYGCAIKDTDELHDPKINLECAVKIATYWINKDGQFFGAEKNGLGRYWHVGRASSSSNAKILAYLASL